jgi:hypothetical protein
MRKKEIFYKKSEGHPHDQIRKSKIQKYSIFVLQSKVISFEDTFTFPIHENRPHEIRHLLKSISSLYRIPNLGETWILDSCLSHF